MLTQLPAQHPNTAVAHHSQNDVLNSFWFFALATLFAGAFYFFSYYFWGTLWGVLHGG